MPPKPLILAFDTSAAHCAAALLSGGEVIGAVHEEMAKGQAESLFPILESVLKDAGVNFQDLSALGVGTGPGNFTGVRISVSAARGLALSLGIPAVGVSLLEAAAFGTDGPVITAFDARRNAVYFQGFETPYEIPAQMSDLTDLSLDPIDGNMNWAHGRRDGRKTEWDGGTSEICTRLGGWQNCRDAMGQTTNTSSAIVP